MAIVVESSALIGLSRIGRLGLLKQLYGFVLIPEAVFREVVNAGQRLGKDDIEDVEQAIGQGWIDVQPLGNQSRERAVTYRSGGVGDGEVECVVLAVDNELQVVFDDRRARRLAISMGLELTGTGGVLLEARLRGMLTRPEYLESLRDLAGVTRISADVVAELMRLGLELEE